MPPNITNNWQKWKNREMKKLRDKNRDKNIQRVIKKEAGQVLIYDVGARNKALFKDIFSILQWICDALLMDVKILHL